MTMPPFPNHKLLLSDAGIDWPLSPDTEERLVRFLSSGRDAQAIAQKARETAESATCSNTCTFGSALTLVALAVEARSATAERGDQMLAMIYARGEPKKIAGLSVGKIQVGFAALVVLCITILFVTRFGAVTYQTNESGSKTVNVGVPNNGH